MKSQATTGLRLILRQIERYQQRRCTCDPTDEESGAFCISCTAESALQELLDSAEGELAYIEEVLSDRPRRRRRPAKQQQAAQIPFEPRARQAQPQGVWRE